MELRRHFGDVRLEGMEVIGNGVEERQDNRDADETIDQIANWQAIRDRIAANGAFDNGVDCAAKVCTEDQSKRRSGCDEMGPITIGMGYSIPMAVIGIWLIPQATRWTSPGPLDESSTSS